MDFSKTQLIVVTGLLFVLSLAFSAYAWSRANLLYLPIPTSLTAIATFLPVITTVLVPGTAILLRRIKTELHRLPPILAYLLALSAVVSFTIALTYAHPSAAQTCQLETRWARYFQSKDADAIRSIQSVLRCCGLRSMHDRAWPFPSRDVDARQCERTAGYSRSCLGPWRREESRAAGMIALGSLLVWALAFALHHIIHQHQSVAGEQPISERRPLLEDGRNRPLSDSGHRQIHDAPDSPIHEDDEAEQEVSGNRQRDTESQ